MLDPQHCVQKQAASGKGVVQLLCFGLSFKRLLSPHLNTFVSIRLPFSMSGLYRFFRSHLPDADKEVAQEAAEEKAVSAAADSSGSVSSGSDSSDDESSKFVSSYEISLHSIRESNRQLQDDQFDQDDDGDELQTNEGIDQNGEDNGTNNSEAELLNYNRWRKERKEDLLRYMSTRIGQNSSETGEASDADSDWYSSEEESDDDIMDEANAEKVWDSQQLQSASQDLENRPNNQGPPSSISTTHRDGDHLIRERRMPLLSEVVHSVSRMDDLDLYTKELTLELCRVDKVWPLRSTKRCAYHPFSERFIKCFGHSNGRAPRLPFGFKEEDGFMSSCYKQVLSMEVVQLNLPGSKHAQIAPRVSCSTSSFPRHRKHRMKVFIYGEYAVSIQEWIDGLSERPRPGRNVFISFRRVPGVCVVPYAKSNQNWLDSDQLIGYCLVIGDETKLKIDANRGPLRFDKMPTEDGNSSASLELRLAVDTGPSQESTSELVLSSENLERKNVDGMSALYSSSPRVLDGFREWQAQQQATIVTDNNTSVISEVAQKRKDANGLVPNEENEWTRKMVSGTNSASGDMLLGVRNENEHGPAQRQVSLSGGDNFAGTASNKQHLLNDGGSFDATASAPREGNTSASGSDEGSNSQNDPGGDNRIVTRPSPIFADERQAKRMKVGERAESKAAHKVNTSGAFKQYEKLGDLRNLLTNRASRKDPRVNVYGVVMGFTSPSRTKKGTWMITVSLVDDSLAETTHGNGDPPITLNIFCKKRDEIPQLHRMGDVLRLHRVALKDYNGGLQLTGFETGCSYVVCREHEFIPVASESFTVTEGDKTRAFGLWKWGQNRIMKTPTIRRESRVTIGQIGNFSQNADSMGGAFSDRDLTVMVAAKFSTPTQARAPLPAGFLRVWDGTGASESDGSPIPGVPLAELLQARDDPPFEALEALGLAVEQLKYEASIAPQVEKPDRFCGRVINAAIWERELWDYIDSRVEVGSFIRLRNVSGYSPPGINLGCLNVGAKTWLSIVPDKTYEVRVMLEDHHVRIRRNDRFNPNAAVSHPPEVLQAYFEQKELGNFQGIVKVRSVFAGTRYSPSRICVPLSNGDGFVYRFGVELEDDSTSDFTAVVTDAAAESMLGMPASEACVLEFGDLRKIICSGNTDWSVTLKSVETPDGSKYFTVVNIENTGTSHMEQ